MKAKTDSMAFRVNVNTDDSWADENYLLKGLGQTYVCHGEGTITLGYSTGHRFWCGLNFYSLYA